MTTPSRVKEHELARRIASLRETPLSPEHDPWDPYLTGTWAGRPLLTSIEVTVTNLCNLRCEHCAVGDLLTPAEERSVSVEEIIERLDEVETLVTFSLTGGEPAASPQVVERVVLPLLEYAKSRGLRTQVNTNLTLPLARYEAFVDCLDVLHISYNYPDAAAFARVAYAHAAHPPARPEFAFRRLEENTRSLASAGVFVSAETILTGAVLPHIAEIHARIRDLGCMRHEIHPLYPSDFAASMRVPSLEEVAVGVETLLDARDPGVWILFGTFPFFACSPDLRHRNLLARVRETANTTVRNDPDGRNRLNISSLTGDVLVQDFADHGPLGNIRLSRLDTIWNDWLESDVRKRISCTCAAARCLGPNLIVADTYFPEVDWKQREALFHLHRTTAP